MTRLPSRPFRALLALPVIAATAALAVPSAGADQVTPIGPAQLFVGQTHGPLGVDKILVLCPGAAAVGHPAAGQSVEVLPAPATARAGFTGADATAVAVSFSGGPTAVPLLLQAYDVPVALPTTLALPCDGAGHVTFTPDIMVVRPS